MGMTLYEAILDDVKKDYAEMKEYDEYETARQFEHEVELQRRELKFKARAVDALMTSLNSLTQAIISEKSKPNITIQVDSSMTPEKFEEIMKIVNKYR